MAELTLVRHGQAMAFESDPDRLSELGVIQAQRLGASWAASRLPIDVVVSGSLRRHRQTEAAVRDAYRAAGLTLPDLEIDPGWNEYDAHAVVSHLGPRLVEQEPGFAGVYEGAVNASGPDRNRYFQRAFEVLLEAWADGRVSAPEVEPFADFHNRVKAARARAFARRGVSRVVVFTSAGPIGVCTQLTLEAPPVHGLYLNNRVRNASLSSFLFSATRRPSLDSFNLVSHLAPELVTFR